MTPIPVVLEAGQVHVASYLAARRFVNNLLAGVVEQKKGEFDSIEIMFEGICAEFAVAQVYNLCPDLTTQPRSGSFDFVTPGGATVDVKHTRYISGDLIMNINKTKDESKVAHLYILVVGTSPNLSIVGWAKGSELIASVTNKYGHGDTCGLSQDKLHDPQSLQEAIWRNHLRE